MDREANHAPDTTVDVRDPEAPPQVGKDFHVIDALVREFRRLQAEPQTEDTGVKSDLLAGRISQLVGLVEAAPPEMTNAERRILTAGLEVSLAEQ